MEIATETLFKEGMPAATNQSPKDDDLLQRSSKKTKRGRGTSEHNRSKSMEGIVQETPLGAGLMSPESNQWRTPVETPSNAWGKKGQCNVDGQKEGDKTAEDASGQGQKGFNQTCAKPQMVHQVSKPVRDLKQNFGEWMLVARKERGGNRRGGARPQDPPIQSHAQPSPPPADREGPQLSARYAILEDLDGLMADDPPPGRSAVVPVQKTTRTLPIIRTNHENQNPRGQNAIPQQPTVRQSTPASRGSFRGRSGRGGAPRRAAAESEHVVVRGSNKGKHITSTVVIHSKDVLEPSRKVDVDYELTGDPPDNPGWYANRPEYFEESTFEENGQFDPGDMLMRDQECS
nr:uncharacterized protein LOC109179535 isoform X2 [Ipomoea batatas]